jgi:hypothetical protein
MDVVIGVLRSHEQPSAWDLVNIIERELGWKARWCLKAAVNELKSASTSKKAWRGYLDSLTESGDLVNWHSYDLLSAPVKAAQNPLPRQFLQVHESKSSENPRLGCPQTGDFGQAA